MKLTKEDIQSMDKVGAAGKNSELYHIVTKGGLNLIVKKSMGGEFTVLGQGPHRSFAIHQAEAVEKSIQWEQSLFKSDEFYGQRTDPATSPSTPQAHYDLASQHAKAAGKYQTAKKVLESVGVNPVNDPEAKHHHSDMMGLKHEREAFRHFQMSGMDPKSAKAEVFKHAQLHHEMPDAEEPDFGRSYGLELEWNKKNGKYANREFGS